MAIPLLDSLDLKDTDITADALLTQRKLAEYLVDKRKAHFHFIVKANQASLLDDLMLLFNDRKHPDFVRLDPPDHGRIETRQIWTSTELNGYLDFPHIAQVFLIERIVVNKKTGQSSRDLAYRITSRSPQQTDPKRLLDINRGHWTIENSCHYILDWNFDEDRCRIRTGYGPENVTRLRRFAIGLIKSKGVKNVAQWRKGDILNFMPNPPSASARRGIRAADAGRVCRAWHRASRGESPHARFSRSRRLGEGQGRHREVGSEGSPIQKYGATNRNWMTGEKAGRVSVR